MTAAASHSRISAASAFRFVLTSGIVNLFADMTYEGGGSIHGRFLATLGASAAAISIIAGAGEFLGYALRSVAGYIADKTGRYWLLTFLGYSVNLLAVPVAYGILLDDASPDWRRIVRGNSDLGQMLMAAMDVTPAKDAVEASQRYGGAELRTAEQTRAEQRTAHMRELRNRFVDGPVLIVPSGGWWIV
jgi:hypothetical protein